MTSADMRQAVAIVEANAERRFARAAFFAVALAAGVFSAWTEHFHVGAQGVHWEPKGAFTGEVAPGMVKEFCGYVIIGHSERRTLFVLHRRRLHTLPDGVTLGSGCPVDVLAWTETGGFAGYQRLLDLPAVQADTEDLPFRRNQFGFLLTGHDLRHLKKMDALPFETSVPGIFAAGDVRYGTNHRVASAAGEGAIAYALMKEYLKSL